MRINKRNTSPSLQRARAAARPDRQGTEFGDGPAITRYREALPRFDPIDDLAAAVTQIANRDFWHLASVSRVRRRGRLRQPDGADPLMAFINELNAQSGKHVLSTCSIGGATSDPAAVLISDARRLISSLT